MILTDFVADCARRLAPATVRRYAQFLELFRRWAGEAPAERLSYQWLSDYHLHLCAPETGRHLHRRGPETVRKHLESIEVLWKWAWQRQARGDYVGVPQPDSLGLTRTPAPHQLAPTWSQMDAAIGAATGWQRDLYVVLRSTGLRVQQALGLRWEDVDLDAARLRIRPELGKSPQEKRGRWVPIAPVLVAELAAWGRREGFVVRCERDRRVARARDAARAWKRAGVDPAVWQGSPHHAFRAGFASSLKRLGADTEAVEFLVGHSRGIREHYVGPDALPLVEVVALVPSLHLAVAQAPGLAIVK